MFVDGEWCDAASGATVEALSPATGESLGPVADGDRDDARRAIAAANAAFPAWATRSGSGGWLPRLRDGRSALPSGSRPVTSRCWAIPGSFFGETRPRFRTL